MNCKITYSYSDERAHPYTLQLTKHNQSLLWYALEIVQWLRTIFECRHNGTKIPIFDSIYLECKTSVYLSPLVPHLYVSDLG